MFSFLLNNVNLILLIVIYIQSVLKLCFLEFESTPQYCAFSWNPAQNDVCVSNPNGVASPPNKWTKINGFHWGYFTPYKWS